jgi:hypothetical protein
MLEPLEEIAVASRLTGLATERAHVDWCRAAPTTFVARGFCRQPG